MRGLRVLAFAATLLTLPPAVAQQRTYLNLDFETATRGRPWAWSTGGAAYDFALDTAAPNSGAQSLRIRYTGGQFGSSAVQTLLLDATAGKRVRFTGYLRTEGITQGNAGLWLRVDGASGMLALDNAPLGVTNGTTDWQRFVIDRYVDPAAIQVVFGAFQFGNGTAWFDNFSVEIDGVPLAEGPPPNVGEPTAAQLDWLQRTANPFFTEKAGNGLDDLWPVEGIVGGVHIVGLGEGTHGSAEFFHMKHRLLEYLATKMGFTIFSIEANMPEAYALNDYVLNGIGDPKRLLQGMYFWTWNTQEVLDMVGWMRQFNLSGKGRLQFTGFDMQTGTVAMNIVRNFVAQADPDYSPTLNVAFFAAALVQQNYSRQIAQTTADIQAASDGMHAVWQHLTDRRSGYLANLPAETVDWAIQNAKVSEQATYYALGGTAYRDQCMAANFEWILQQNPGAKAVVWAHDYHISRVKGAMGSYIAASHGTDYLAVGQVFHAGGYNAVNNGRLIPNDATPSFPGSIEYVLHSTGMPKFILDMRRAAPGDPGSSWLFGQTQYRSIGALATDGFGFTYQLTTDYDVLVFFDHVNPSVLLPFN